MGKGNLLSFQVSTEIDLDQIFQPNNKFCFLAGSGVSVDPPSSLLTGYQFTKAILENIIPKQHKSSILRLVEFERENMRNPGDFLRFEQLMEYLIEYDPELHVLDYFADSTIPNLNHLFLALMILQNHVVMTTNFDNLIEHALHSLNISKQQIFPIIFKEDWESYEEKKEKFFMIFKLHGSIIDVRSQKRCLESLKATIKQISSGEGQLFQLEAIIRNVLEKNLQENDLIVLGYSGLDDFDILPTLWNITSKKRLIWILHDSKVDLMDAKIEIVIKHENAQDITPSVLKDRNAQNLLKFLLQGKRIASNVFRITVNTKKLIQYLWKKYLVEDFSPLVQTKIDTQPLNLKLTLRLLESEKWALSGKIYHDRHLLKDSQGAYNKAIQLAETENKPKTKADCLTMLGWIFYRMYQIEESLTYFRNANEIYKSLRDFRGQIITLNSMGMSIQRGKEYDKSLEFFDMALQLSIQVNDLQWKARTLNNIGNVYGNKREYSKALNYYTQAHDINKQLGDIQALATNLLNIADIYIIQRSFSNAKKNCDRSLKISEKIGDLPKKVNCLTRIARIHELQRNFSDSISYYEEALPLTDHLNAFAFKFQILYILGNTYMQDGDLSKALSYYLQANLLFNEIDEEELRVVFPIIQRVGKYTLKLQVLNSIGNIYGLKGNLQEGLETFQKTLNYIDDVRDPTWKGASFQNLGMMYYTLGQNDKALEFLYKALNIFKKADLTMQYQRVFQNIRKIKGIGGFF